MPRFVTWNERDNPDLPPGQVQADFNLGKRMFKGSVLLGFQEIGEVADHVSLGRAFTKPFVQLFRRKPTPIVYNSRYMKADALQYVVAHGGLAGRSPQRGYSIARIKLRYRPRIKRFYVINTHMVSKPDKDEWGREHWEQHWHSMQREVLDLHSAGYDVILMGDLNRVKLPSKIHPLQRVLAHNGLDWILYVPGANGNLVSVSDVNTYQKQFYTDHAVLELVLRMEVRK